MLTLYLLLGFVLFLAVALLGIAGWFCSEELLRVKKGERVYLTKGRVVGITAETITFQRTRNTAYDGTYGVDWPYHSAVVGKIIAITKRTVTRQLLKATQMPAVGARVRWNIFVYPGEPERALGLAYDDVLIPSQLGTLPAWFISGQPPTWVIMVHGYNATREEGLRVLPLVAGLGFPVLNISYRNDPGAPLSPDRLYHLGIPSGKIWRRVSTTP